MRGRDAELSWDERNGSDYFWVVTGMDAIGSNWLNNSRNARGYAHSHRTVFSPFLQEPCRAILGFWAFIRARAPAGVSLGGCKAREANECSPKLECQPTFHNGKKLFGSHRQTQSGLQGAPSGKKEIGACRAMSYVL